MDSSGISGAVDVKDCSLNVGLFYFHVKFNIFSNSVNCIEILMGITLNLLIVFGRMDRFIIFILGNIIMRGLSLLSFFLFLFFSVLTFLLYKYFIWLDLFQDPPPFTVLEFL